MPVCGKRLRILPLSCIRLRPAGDGNILAPERDGEVGMRFRVLLLAALVAAGANSAAIAAGSGNPMTDRLLAEPEGRRSEILAHLVRHNCVGTHAFLMGVTVSGRARGYAYWSLACQNGQSYVIQIRPDKKGTALVEDCRVLRGTGRECFKQF
jgi:hypothetical protein